MKYALLLFALFFCSHLTMAQDKPTIKIHCIAPVKLKTGQTVKLKVSVSHNLKEEKTGTLVLSLINHQTQKSVDGWFLNIFPFQYFTTLKNEKFETEFPFTVPNDCIDGFDMILIAAVNELKDSIRFTIPNKKIIPIAKKS
jgi:hypothetical protein